MIDRRTAPLSKKDRDQAFHVRAITGSFHRAVSNAIGLSNTSGKPVCLSYEGKQYNFVNHSGTPMPVSPKDRPGVDL